MTMTHGIADPLLQLAVPVVNLTELPGNPRQGDVAAIARSFRVFGQRKPLWSARVGTDAAWRADRDHHSWESRSESSS